MNPPALWADPAAASIIALASFLAGALNAIAGGGTNITFPTLLWLGVPPVEAVATNSVGLWPGSLGGAWGLRAEIAGVPRSWTWTMWPCVIGGLAGAWLLVNTPPQWLVWVAPWLVLGSSVLIAVEPRLRRRALAGDHEGAGRPRRRRVAALLAALAIAAYGGYYGAGIGILLLTMLGVMGVHDIHQANGVKNILSVAIKGASIIYLIAAGAVLWGIMLLMAAASLLGGYAGARAGRRVRERRMRAVVVAVGAVIAVAMLVDLFAV